MDVPFYDRACSLCRSKDHRTLFSDINRREALNVSGTLVECRACGMRFLSPAPGEEGLEQLYESGAVDPVSLDPGTVMPVAKTRPSPGWSRKAANVVNGWLRGHPHNLPAEQGHGRTILDFGCFSGDKLSFWYQRDWQVAGIDLNRKAIDIARRRYPDGRFWCGNLFDLKIEQTFDVIRTDNVLEHLLDPVSCLTALRKMLKPGGMFYVYVPNAASLNVRMFGRYSHIYWMPFHLNLFSPATLRSALMQAGLRQVRCRTFTPVNSWSESFRQFLLPSGYMLVEPTLPDRFLQKTSLLHYPLETFAQWAGMGDEVIGVGTG